jgi:hypothetical protein
LICGNFLGGGGNFVLAAKKFFFFGPLEKNPTKIWGASPPLDLDKLKFIEGIRDNVCRTHQHVANVLTNWFALKL